MIGFMNKRNYKRLIIERINENITLANSLPELWKIIEEIARIILNAYRKRRKVILFGNGGSAADAQHIAAELLGKYYLKRKGLPAIALTTNTSSLTAISNDFDFDETFSFQLDALGEKGDIAWGFTTSGTSKNVIQAFKIAKRRGLITIAFTGRRGERLKKMVDYLLIIPSTDTPRIQEAHILIGHIICEIVEQELFR